MWRCGPGRTSRFCRATAKRGWHYRWFRRERSRSGQRSVRPNLRLKRPRRTRASAAGLGHVRVLKGTEKEWTWPPRAELRLNPPVSRGHASWWRRTPSCCAGWTPRRLARGLLAGIRGFSPPFLRSSKKFGMAQTKRRDCSSLPRTWPRANRLEQCRWHAFLGWHTEAASRERLWQWPPNLWSR